MARLALKVTPNAKKSEILGWVDSAGGARVLRVKLKARPVDGKANRELIAFLAKSIGVPKGAVSIVHGEKNRIKTIEISGIGETELRDQLP